MAFLSIVGYILLFILCLSVLIVVHEAGHFAMAKAFNVYCLDFSIGFGPALFHRKRKNGETYFSIRAFPLGGYVSMYGEGVELPEGVEVPPERSFENIKKWKRIIILFAGVFNNCILALIIFFISEAACIQKSFVYYQQEASSQTVCFRIDAKEDSAASKAGITAGEWNEYTRIHSNDENEYFASSFILDKEAVLTYQNDTTEKVAAVVKTDELTFVNKDFQTNLHFYTLTDAKKSTVFDGIDLDDEITASNSAIKTISFNVTTVTLDRGEDDSVVEKERKVSNFSIGRKLNDDQTWSFEDSGLTFYIWERYNSFGDVVQNTFVDFGYSAGVIYRSLGSLFVSAENWKNVGGIISIGVQTSNILANMGIGRFLYVWALISVNLAIINLLPFPGLDGWQILVLVVEMVAHREIPEKVKNIVSIVGLVLLMALAALILVKDIIGLF
ncbi:MAG: RIP metalloprotease RseP [Bacilli bacterium]|nr:RIP metalloprotease RseP [Bacilli bacterium]